MDTTDLQSLREDLNKLKDTFAEFVSQAGIDAVKTARDVTSNVASQVGNAASNVAEKGSEIATTASKQAKGLLPPSSRPSGVTIRSVQWLPP